MEKETNPARILRPLLTSLRISGLFYDHNKCYRILHSIYAAILTLLTITACLSQGYCIYITGVSRRTSFKFMIIMEFIRGLFITFWNLFCFPGRLHTFLELWSECSTYKNLSEVVSMTFKRFFFSTMFVMNLAFVLLMGSMLYQVIATGICFTCLGTDTTVVWPNYLLVTVYSLFTSYHGIVILLSYIACGYIVKREFDNIKSKVVGLDKQVLNVNDILQCRQTYSSICGLLEGADNCFLPHSFQIYVYCPINLCMSVYSALYEPDPNSVLPFLFATNSMLILTFLLSGTVAGTVHNSTNKLLDSLHRFRTHQLTQPAYNEVMLFISELSSADIGFTVARMFVLSKSSIMTIVGTAVSYLIVAVQFKPERGNDSHTNTTIPM